MTLGLVAEEKHQCQSHFQLKPVIQFEKQTQIFNPETLLPFELKGESKKIVDELRFLAKFVFCLKSFFSVLI
jgi:hypothetical protein